MTLNSIGKWIYKVASRLTMALLSPLVLYGFHPASLKKAAGIVLDKPGKRSYDSPSSFRVILLLQTFSKIMERIINSHLACAAQVMGLLNPHQCGSLAGLSVVDACNTLTHEVRTLQMDKRKVFTLCRDIKGGFNNVNPFTRCRMLTTKGVSQYIVCWTCSFLLGRACRLLCQGSPKVFSPMSVGTAEGSPISLLLFVLYVARLHIEIPYDLTLF